LFFFDFLAMAREPTGAPAWLRPHCEVAERVLAPGDPGRALRLAQALTDQPRMVNHARGLWGYTGTAEDGAPLTIQSTGLGGPSAAAVVRDLARLGARRVVRVGTCAAVADDLVLGTLHAPDPVFAADGASRALGAGERLRPSLTGTLGAIALATTDLDDAHAPAGARARDLTTAAVLAAAAACGLAAGAVVVVATDAAGRRLDDDALHAAELEAGRAALALIATG
jgi:purine-nucleoside phosphorylase